ncbi:SCO5918 family protein [Streptomyces achromogenes]|uniref:SCO5918 family protein n=1 Tax=Streptomyces achromogenes TaxID=67255 RepID=A0ABZ1KTS5_STRAH
MRCVIARYPFELTRTGVLDSMKGVKPEPVTGAAVTIGRRRYPAKQVGRILTRQDPRDFTAGEVTRAMTRLGFTCHDQPAATPVGAPVDLGAGLGVPGALRTASALLGGPGPVAV